jgi:DNA-binding PucR family transcriptional regulator
VEKRFDEVSAEQEIPSELRWRVAAHATRYFFAYVDSVCTQLVRDYEEERARWIRGAAAARTELVTAIIGGEPVDPREATATLRYDVTRRHLCFVVWTDVEGLAGMRRSYEEARSARRVAEVMRARPGSITRYSTAALTAVLTADPGEAVRFAEAQLGALAEPDDAMTRLRATARIYLDENLSPARTARRLGIHQNTVVYRVKRTEEILGRELSSAPVEFGVALRLAEGLDGLRAAAS